MSLGNIQRSSHIKVVFVWNVFVLWSYSVEYIICFRNSVFPLSFKNSISIHIQHKGIVFVENVSFIYGICFPSTSQVSCILHMDGTWSVSWSSIPIFLFCVYQKQRSLECQSTPLPTYVTNGIISFYRTTSFLYLGTPTGNFPLYQCSQQTFFILTVHTSQN